MSAMSDPNLAGQGSAKPAQTDGEIAPPRQHQNDRHLDEVWGMRHGDGLGRAAYVAAARRLGWIDSTWSRTATACSSAHPCYECCLRALRALEAAAEIGSNAQVQS